MKLKEKNKNQAEKEQYQGKIEKEFQEWGSKIDNLIGKVNQYKDDSKVDIQEHIKTIQSKQNDLREKLSSLKTESGSAWHEVKNGIEGAWKELKNGVENAYDKFNERKPADVKKK